MHPTRRFLAKATGVANLAPKANILPKDFSRAPILVQMALAAWAMTTCAEHSASKRGCGNVPASVAGLSAILGEHTADPMFKPITVPRGIDKATSLGPSTRPKRAFFPLDNEDIPMLH